MTIIQYNKCNGFVFWSFVFLAFNGYKVSWVAVELCTVTSTYTLTIAFNSKHSSNVFNIFPFQFNIYLVECICPGSLLNQLINKIKFSKKKNSPPRVIQLFFIVISAYRFFSVNITNLIELILHTKKMHRSRVFHWFEWVTIVSFSLKWPSRMQPHKFLSKIVNLFESHFLRCYNVLISFNDHQLRKCAHLFYIR